MKGGDVTCFFWLVLAVLGGHLAIYCSSAALLRIGSSVGSSDCGWLPQKFCLPSGQKEMLANFFQDPNLLGPNSAAKNAPKATKEVKAEKGEAKQWQNRAFSADSAPTEGIRSQMPGIWAPMVQNPASASVHGDTGENQSKTLGFLCFHSSFSPVALFAPFFREFCWSLRALNVSENLADPAVQQPVLARTA